MSRRPRRSRVINPPWYSPVLVMRRIGNNIQVAVVSNIHLSAQAFHWYQDGTYIGSTSVPYRGFRLEAGEQSRIDVIPSSNPAFDPEIQAPTLEPSPRRVIELFRSLDTDVGEYYLQQASSSNGVFWSDFITVRIIAHDSVRWSYRATTEILDDLTHYQWRIASVDDAGNEGTIGTSIGPEELVRRPDAPDFTVTFDEGTAKVTFAAA